MIRAFEKKSASQSIPGLYLNDTLITEPKEIANILASHFAQASSDNEVHINSIAQKLTLDPTTIDFLTPAQESYNNPFTMHELLAAITSSKAGATGEDYFHLQMLISMPDETLYLVLQLFNQLWKAGLFPTCWKIAIVIPILKPGKNPFLADSYRPISLLSVIGKIFEKLIWYGCWKIEIYYLLHNADSDQGVQPKINYLPYRHKSRNPSRCIIIY